MQPKKIEIQKSVSHTFEWTFYDHNIQEIPVSGTVTIYKPGGDTELVASTAVSIETDGTIKYTLESSNTGTVDRNYKIALTYQVGDVVKRPFYLFDIVETPLQNTVRDEDLFKYVGELRDKTFNQVIETTSAGTATTFISTELASLNQDFKGGNAEIYLDDTTTHMAEITNYESDIYRCTFTPAYTSAISVNLKILIRSSFQRYIDTAYNDIVHRDIRNRVPIKAGYIDTTVTDNMTIYKALEIICFDRSEEDNDKWDRRAKKFNDMYNSEMSKLSEAYDYNEDGDIDLYEQNEPPSFLNINISR
jgi:hypothetical protein